MRENARMDFFQIENERRNSLELILIVLTLGFLLNAIVTILFFIVNPEKITWIHFWVLVLISIVLVFLYLFLGILRPAKLRTQIPAVLFFNIVDKTISIPVEIHYLNSNHSLNSQLGIMSTPFPILCRIFFDKYKQDASEDIDVADPLKIQNLLSPLIQYIFIDLYANEHMGTWGRYNSFKTGPFRSGFAADKPSQEFLQAELAQKSKNVFFKKFAYGLPVVLPNNTAVNFPSPQEVEFSSNLYSLKIRILCLSGLNMSPWNFTHGTTSTWYRKLDSDYDNTFAFLFSVQFDFKLKIGVRRFFAEEWLPAFIQPKDSLRDICSWANHIIEIAESYFDWVDEDIFSLPNHEISILEDISTLTYKSQSPGNSSIRFRS